MVYSRAGDKHQNANVSHPRLPLILSTPSSRSSDVDSWDHVLNLTTEIESII